MEDLYKVLDELASVSGDQYTTIAEVVERCYGTKVKSAYRTSEANRLRTWLHRHKEAVDYKDGASVEEGFRYKKGYEYYYKELEEEKLRQRMDENGRQLFITGGLQMLFGGKTSFNHKIEVECDERLTNLSIVKELAKYLGKTVISFQYLQGFENMQKITMHPHLLKEYNSRWFLFGYVVEESGYPKVVNFALDRIEYRKPEDIKILRQETFVRAPRNFYDEYFKDIVGVTRKEGGVVETITIRTTDFKVHHLLRTKPIHASQQETMPFDMEKSEGEFTIQVIPNIELQTRLLSYGPGLYVVGEGKFQQQMRDAVSHMNNHY